MEQELKLKKRGVSGVVVFLLIILFLAIGLGAGWYVGKNNLLPIGKEKEAEVEEEKEEKKEVSDDIKEKLDSFIDVASYYNYSMAALPEQFYKGITASEITDSYKVTMTYVKLIELDKNYEQTTNIPQNVSDSVGGAENESVKTVLITDFDKVYKNLFNETPQYNANSKGCPYPTVVDQATGKIYLFSRCGGISGEIVNEVKNKTYAFDGEYYTVSTDVSYYPKDGETSTVKVTWKFDKDLNFVSTTAE